MSFAQPRPSGTARRRLLRRVAWQLAAAATAVTSASTTLAADILWDGGGFNSEWIEPANWTNNQIPSTGDTAIIVDDTALVTASVPPTVMRVEIGQAGAPPGGLVIDGGTGPLGFAALNVVNGVAVADGSGLTLGGGPGTSQLNVINGGLTTSGVVSVLRHGTVTLGTTLNQIGGTVTLSDATLDATNVNARAGMFDATGMVNADVTVGNGDALPATLAVGAGIGDLSIDGDLELMSDGILQVQFSDASRGGAFDTINVTGTATLGGTLDLSVLSGAPTPGTTYTLLTAQNLKGRFDDIIGVPAPGGGSWVPEFDLTGVSFQISAERGDMNADDIVDENDVELFAYALRDENSYHFDYYLQGLVAESFMADMDFDGSNTFADIPLFLEAVDQAGGSVTAAMATISAVLSAVPEPSTSVLAVGLSALSVLARRRLRPFVKRSS